MNNNYQADLILFTPYFYSGNPVFEQGKPNDAAAGYLGTVDRVFGYECVAEIACDIKRAYLGRFEITCASDSAVHAKAQHAEEAMLFAVYSAVTHLALIEAVFPDIKAPLTFMLEEMYRNNGRIVTPSEEIGFDAYFEKNFGMTRCGAMKHLSTLSGVPADRDELMYIAMAEEYGTQDIDSKLRPAAMAAGENISQYEAFDIYASNAGVTLIFKEWQRVFPERLYFEAMVVLSVELIMFKIAAVMRTNRDAIKKLECESYPSLKIIDDMSSQFARTIRFWDTDNFRYLSTRNMAREIAQAFESENIMQGYMRNLSFLEHLISIRSAQASERENKVLGFLAIVLTLVQIVPLMYSIIEYVFLNTIGFRQFFTAFSACGLTAAAALAVVFLLKKFNK